MIGYVWWRYRVTAIFLAVMAALMLLAALVAP